MRNIGLAGIAVLPEYREKLRPERVDELVNWMRIKRRNGYLTPPTGFKPITPRQKAIGYFLVDGLHRLEAARKLGWEAIPARILDESY
jgi:ParB-like chromosome segregation protein Spo0J